MSRNSTKARMKVISGGKQLSFIRDTEEVLKFLNHTARIGSLSQEEIDERIKACEICFSKITEEQDCLPWILSNLPTILGDEPEAILKRVRAALEDYKSWSSDPFAWERKQKEGEMAQKDSPKPSAPLKKEKTLTFPISKHQCVEVKIPEGGLSTDEFLRLGLFLYPYCNDLDLTKTFSWVKPLDND